MKKWNPKKYDREHDRRLLLYQQRIEAIYDEYAQEAALIGASVGNVAADTLFSFSDYPLTQKRVRNLLSGLKNDLFVCIVNGVRSEWTLANNKNNELSRLVFGDNVGKLSQAQYRRYFSTNEAAREAFLSRKVGGLDLSERVWRYAKQFRGEIELGLDVGIRNGLSAAEMTKELRQYLRHPDKLFRRVRDEHGNLQLSKAAAEFHPGQGVYRSSYKNARRLAATETNIAYHTADHDRWQDMDFVVGIEIKLSNNHTLNGLPFQDICDDLKGRYPKDFKFTGWHPHCRCHAVTILKSQEEMMEETRAILRGEQPSKDSKNAVRDVPQAFKDWMADNEDRLRRSQSVPYFLSDNPKYSGVAPHYGAVGSVTGTKLGRSATKAAYKVYDGTSAPTMTREVTQNTKEVAALFGITEPVRPMTFLDADAGRGNVDFGRGFEFSNNCQVSVAVHEARLRGLNVTARGYSRDKDSIPYQLGERFQDIWVHPKTGRTPQPTEIRGSGFDDMLSRLEKQSKATGRYHIGINMASEGHVITAERLADGSLVYYDAQSGEFLNIMEYAAKGVEYFELLKVDKLLFRKDWLRSVARLL